MRASHAEGPASISGRDVSWVRFSRDFSSPLRQMSGSFRPPRSPNIIWPSLSSSSLIIHYGRQWPEMLTRPKTSNMHTYNKRKTKPFLSLSLSFSLSFRGAEVFLSRYFSVWEWFRQWRDLYFGLGGFAFLPQGYFMNKIKHRMTEKLAACNVGFSVSRSGAEMM